MPLYEYKCPDCGTKVEVLFHRTTRVPTVAECPKCGKCAERVTHPGGAFQLKGNWPGKGGY